MREHFNGEQSCEEQREEEKLAAFLEEQMRKEAEQIEKELEDNPEIAALSPDDSAKEKLYERIEEYERQQAVRRLSPEDQEALRLGRQLQKEKAGGEEAAVDSKSRSGHGKRKPRPVSKPGVGKSASSSAWPESPQCSSSWRLWGSQASADRIG